jgi:hypothetical protein
LFLQPSLGGEEWLILVDGEKRESGLDVYSNFERMQMSTNSVESLKFQRNFTNPLGFGCITSY